MKEIDKKDMYAVLGKLFEFKEKSNTKINDNDLIGYTDKSQVCMIAPRTTEFKTSMETTFELDAPMSGNAILTIISDAKCGSTTGVSISMDYLKYLLKLSSKYPHIKIYASKDKPVIFETPDFYFVIAHKMESD